MATVSLHDVEQLKLLFNGLPKSRLYWWAPAESLENVQVSVKGVTVKIGSIKSFWRSATLRHRVYYAVRRWLNPETPSELRHLPAILNAAGLDHLNGETVVSAMIDRTREIAQQFPALERWTRSRCALLKLHCAPKESELSAELKRTSVILRRSLTLASHLVWRDELAAREAAWKTGRSALNAAAQAVNHVLAHEDGATLDANLMVPVASSEVERAVRVLHHPRAQELSDRASALWAHVPKSRSCSLLLVMESEHEEHAGFWIPLVEGDGGAYLPGAASAFYNRVGHAIALQDVPPLTGFSATADAEWRTYVRRHLSGRLFVSLPVVIPTNEVGRDVVVGVVNVNVSISEKGEWFRAYHQDWLCRARDAAAVFGELAFDAFLLAQSLEGGVSRLKLETGARELNALPGVGKSIIPAMLSAGNGGEGES